MFRAVRIRLIAYVIGVLAVVLVAAGGAVYALLSHQLDAAVDAQLRVAGTHYPVNLLPPVLTAVKTSDPATGSASGQVTIQAPPLGIPGSGGAPQPTDGVLAVSGPLTPLNKQAPADQSTDGTFVAQWVDGAPTTRLGVVPAGLPDSAAIAAVSSGRDDLRTVTVGGQRYKLLTRALPVPAGSPAVFEQVGLSLAARDREQRIVLLALAGGGALGLVLTLAGGLFLTGRALAPVQLAFNRQRRFVGDASHELRTPLALLRLEAEDLARRLNAADATRPLLRQVDRTARLVDDLLALAQIDEGAAPFEPEPVHVGSLLNDAAAAARRLAAPDVEVTQSAPAELWVAGDRDRLRRVLLILVDNACRAVPSGGSIALRVIAEDAAVALDVTDTGPGIPREHLARVFERFYRVDRARSRSAGGAGLGLSIAHEVVRTHGGTIALESTVGKGTRAVVRLKRLPAPVAETVDELPQLAAM